MFNKKSQNTHRQTLYRVNLGFETGGWNIVTDVKPMLRREGDGAILTGYEYAISIDGNRYYKWRQITFDTRDVDYYHTFEADVEDERMSQLGKSLRNRQNIEIQTHLIGALAMLNQVDCYCYTSERLEIARKKIEEEIAKLEVQIQSLM